MNYEVGDRVVIKPWKLMEEQYGIDRDGNINIASPFLRCAEEELKGTDRVITIGYVFDNFYNSHGLLETRVITEEMILGYAFEYGEEILVSCDNKTWGLEKFCGRGYGYARTNNILGKYGVYTFARPLNKKTKEEPEDLSSGVISIYIENPPVIYDEQDGDQIDNYINSEGEIVIIMDKKDKDKWITLKGR